MAQRASNSERPEPAPPPLNGRLLSAMVQSLQEYAILILDATGRVQSWSVGATRFKGFEADDVVGHPRAVLYAADDAQRADRELDLARRHGRFEEQSWRVRADGSRYWAKVVITAIRDPAGELRGFGEVIRDVTDHHAAIHALRQSEARFRAVTESATDAIISVSASGRIVGWNPAASQMYGYSSAEALGMDAMRIVPPSMRPSARELLDGPSPDRLAPDADGPQERLALRSDGSEFPAEISWGHWESDGEHHLTAIVRDITERKRSEQTLQHLADHDSLTGLFNRRRFEDELTRIVSEADRYRRRAALLVLDLDGFKEVNDRHGHSAGDETIAKVGALLAESVRESDIVARLGGDEFGVVVHEADRSQAEIVAEKIIQTVHERGVVISDLVRAHVTASVGITLLDAGVETSAEQLLAEADGAMYDAKARGRNRYAFHHRGPTAGPGLTARHSWLERLRDALDNDRFVLHAQPIVGIQADDCPRHELLLRLRGENGELISPGAFLDNAERFDLIGEIDRWVLARAVRLLHDHHVRGRIMHLTVNLSGKTLNDAAIVDDLRAMLAAHPVPPGRLVVEVTETAAIVNIGRAAALARELRELGCRFALDDFGSGFSSFYYLKHLEFDYLKIDGEFISGLVDTPSDQLVVRAVVDIARGLGSQTIAEFVEDEATVALLGEFGVDYGQGFHLGRPAPLGDRLPSLSVAA